MGRGMANEDIYLYREHKRRPLEYFVVAVVKGLKRNGH